MAAVEFALILPVMITLFFGMVEVSMSLNARAAVVNVAAVTADLVAQKSTLTGSDIKNVFGAASASVISEPARRRHHRDLQHLSMTVLKAPAGKIAWGCKMVNGDPATSVATPTSGVPVDAQGVPPRAAP